MSVNTANPLAKHFRQPSIYIKLPSNGKFWPEGALELPAVGSVAIYPMTAKDEIVLRTPDALLNGQGVIDVIQSCCPSIKNAWQMPSIDIDAVLIAIRIASYGNQMDMEVSCPSCGHKHDVAVDLSYLLDNIKVPDYSKKISTKDIKIKLHPQQYFSVNNSNQIRYEEDRILTALGDTSLPEEVRLAEYSKHLTKIVDLNLDILVNSVEYIETDDNSIVADPGYIKEFFQNCDTEIVHQVQTTLEEISKNAGLPEIEGGCPECEKPYKLPLEFDYANFFGKHF